MRFQNWHISLDDHKTTLREAYASQCACSSEPVKIPLIVRLFENPDSPISFSGAIGLKEHDYIHSILGRGMLPKDEAFVIGFTMGSTRNLSTFAQRMFMMIAKYLYPKHYKWSDEELKTYKAGCDAGRKLCSTPLNNINYDLYMDKPLQDIRKAIGLDIKGLKMVYQCERETFPLSIESQRLLKA